MPLYRCACGRIQCGVRSIGAAGDQGTGIYACVITSIYESPLYDYT